MVSVNEPGMHLTSLLRNVSVVWEASSIVQDHWGTSHTPHEALQCQSLHSYETHFLWRNIADTSSSFPPLIGQVY